MPDKKQQPRKKKKIIVSDPNDPRLRAYQDSLSLYNKTKTIENPKYYEKGEAPMWYHFKGDRYEAQAFAERNNIDHDYEYYRTGKFPGKIQPIDTGDWGEGMKYPIYKKPEQEVVYQKEREKVKPIDIPKSKGIEPLRMTTIDDMEYIPGAKIPEYWNLNRKVVTPTGVNHQRGRINSQKEFNYYNNLKQGEINHPTGGGNSTTITPVYHNISPIIRNIQQFALGGDLNKNINNMNELTQFNEGGTHESNPLGGIPLNQNNKGGTNFVEEGETKIGNYVFSNRLKIDDKILEAFNLPKNLKGKTFAEASKSIDKKFKERVDNISTRTKNGMLDKLTAAQESLKQAEQDRLNQTMSNNASFMEEGLPDNQMALGGIALGLGAVSSGLGIIDRIGGLFKKQPKPLSPEEIAKRQFVADQRDDFFEEGGPTDPSPAEGDPFKDDIILNNMKQWNNDTASQKKASTFIPTFGRKDINPHDNVNSNKSNIDWGTIGRVGSTAAMFAPAIANLFNKPSRPEKVAAHRNTRKFNPYLIDERGSINDLNDMYNASIRNASQIGGSSGQIRNSILASNLNRLRALSSIYNNNRMLNANQKLQVDQLNAGIDEANINRQTVADDLNARNRAAYRTAKNNRMQAIAGNIADIGKFARNAEMIKQAYGYNQYGDYVKWLEEQNRKKGNK